MKIFTYIKKNSTRIKNKNFRNLGGIPVWKNLIYELSSVAQVYIDTDSEEVISECKSDPRLKNVIAYARKKQYIEMENDPNNLVGLTKSANQAFNYPSVNSYLYGMNQLKEGELYGKTVISVWDSPLQLGGV